MTGRHGRQDGIGSRTLDLTQRLAAAKFRDLFRDGMVLVEEVADYLDGPGRDDAKRLPRVLAAAYAAESMRLTTRLMQIASWLLVQKAINEGDFDRAQGLLEKNRVKLTSQGIASQAAIFAELPDTLQDFTARSLQVQTEILRYDMQLKTSEAAAPAFELGILGQLDRLRRAFEPVA